MMLEAAKEEDLTPKDVHAQELVQWYHNHVCTVDADDKEDDAMSASLDLANHRLDETNSRWRSWSGCGWRCCSGW